MISVVMQGISFGLKTISKMDRYFGNGKLWVKMIKLLSWVYRQLWLSGCVFSPGCTPHREHPVDGKGPRGYHTSDTLTVALMRGIFRQSISGEQSSCLQESERDCIYVRQWSSPLLQPSFLHRKPTELEGCVNVFCIVKGCQLHSAIAIPVNGNRGIRLR
ncbi:hypothetical protein ASPWEDRAFT_284994 [Aspergillus wentii DTO 134E9]|uniref:Uncharacterized protein n=1 Tax=Aspergillus wentii DTO 134E9 TaxID=1073089 RepID=A0A1L9S3K8_ASPWE|nr:uncharacterized protein ASPWEDRAFT_284994 [Aspergillus wentii DTO 134E9]OJJ41752.1 hypothetical protein ASPWEDRAFT_284994 [Aspergillus wentii DTO 134E9]